MNALYRANQSKATTSRFSGRRKILAGRLREYIEWHGGKIYLDASTLSDLRDGGWRDEAIERAADDLAFFGVAESRMAGEIEVVELLGVGVGQ